MMQVTFAAVEVQAMTGTASPSWKPRAEARKASADGERATGSHGETASGERRAADAGERLDRDVGDAEQHAGGGAEHRAVVVGGRAEARRGDQQRAERERARLEGDQAGHRERGAACRRAPGA